MANGAIRLTWRDRNWAEQGHYIYRSQTPMNVNNLPNPLTTVDGNVTEYIDYDVIADQTYYYRIGAYRNNDVMVSDEIEVVATPINLGPGSVDLIGGDMTAGFFGEVSSNELITGDDLATQLGITQGTSQYSTEPWLKFALDDEIIYVPKKPLRHSISWEHIYQAGAVYGTDDFGNNPSGGDRLQDARVTIDGFEFKVTLLKGANSDPTADESGFDIPLTHNSEWNRLMYPIHSGVHTRADNPSSPSTPYNQWASYSDSDILVHRDFGNGSYNWTQETHGGSDSYRLRRGYIGVTVVYRTTTTYASSDYGWRPALRLVR